MAGLLLGLDEMGGSNKTGRVAAGIQIALRILTLLEYPYSLQMLTSTGGRRSACSDACVERERSSCGGCDGCGRVPLPVLGQPWPVL